MTSDAATVALAATQRDAALALTDVSVARGGRPVVRGVDLEVPAGQVTALLGPNGAGKSTLVLGIGGVLPIAGAVRIDGCDLAGRSPHQIRAAGLAVVPEGHRVLRGLSVADNLRAAGTGASRSALRAGIEQAWVTFPELEARQGQLAGRLSGGQQQMLAIASALVGQPSYVIIDELSLGLAPVVVERLEPVVRGIAERGIGVLLIEQFATVALRLADRVAIMDRGRIGFRGVADELADRPELLHGVYLAG